MPLVGQAQQILPVAVPTADTLLAQAITTPSGLRYLIRQPGTGPTPRPGDKVLVHYTGFLGNGRIFDASVRQGGPLKVRAGRGEVVKGWDEVLLLLPQGSRARVWIPAALGYGPEGRPDPDDEQRYLIPPNADLVFELEVLKIK
ncbi:FKBP-type peptidyl-prolyl cis-trans isomerase [Hymenobacter luteus]|uniref:Peptidyl-prolyl cis-trans isomerase n=2 Tax=Hymenobacter TaxID=89966 RepID=A0A7W9T320_9BACT|nr:FKBP-type peptidyl-prolyl cis-trans isomerase [Hymenobacter latericoloratus]MBB4602771.1 FKBP-type peptidyl-prolyl cis-trans isomerase [Hymenobacter latericoloratus]MBB6060662.1 FKBP-type peptidyl-prolyl cis-trans isomerase [Hymenobacter luteus]